MSVAVYNGEDADLYVVGDPAPLIGRVCHRLVPIQFLVDGTVRDEALEVLIATDDGWTQLCFDHGMVFWRPDRPAPEPYVSESEGSFVLKEIGAAQGRRLRAVETDIGQLETRLTLRLEGLDVLLVSDVRQDATRVLVQPSQDH